ncbi:MAG: fatty acyl CoA synthetase [Xanthomonadales bacterium]|nr:fatty acyl CoA synthetase [Xanthomonadales bacterium]
MPRPCLPVAWLIALCLPLPAAADPLDDLLAGLRRPAPASEAFHEIRHRRALSAPLVLSGTLEWRGGQAFVRIVERPYRETSVLEGRTLVVRRGTGPERIIPVARAPELEVLFGGLAALFAGDGEAMRRQFTPTLTGAGRWRLMLEPRDPALRARVPALVLYGQGEQTRCLLVEQPGARSLTVFGRGPAPRPLAGPDEEVQALCPQP